MKAKFEAGPWVVKDETEIRSSNGVEQWVAEAHWFYSRRGTKITPKERANARLISAAPDMLAALKGLMLGDNCCCDVAIGNPMYIDHSDSCKAARAAIAKAEGKP